MVCSVSAGSSSSMQRGLRLHVGPMGAHGLLPSEISRMRSKRTIASASSEPQADSRQYFALTYGMLSKEHIGMLNTGSHAYSVYQLHHHLDALRWSCDSLKGKSHEVYSVCKRECLASLY